MIWYVDNYNNFCIGDLHFSNIQFVLVYWIFSYIYWHDIKIGVANGPSNYYLQSQYYNSTLREDRVTLLVAYTHEMIMQFQLDLKWSIIQLQLASVFCSVIQHNACVIILSFEKNKAAIDLISVIKISYHRDIDQQLFKLRIRSLYVQQHRAHWSITSVERP